ncbi:PREDICTED: leucine-rich repeat-containing protein 57 isoform X2 [Cyphomyrmex costatus]|uniref:leucine-rich repeat-containing protein 57 isoform X2 n=1 Tax=Cyphomyrmex costatus TaxID=456900 RepID=UPI00085233D3|nr:PREDICTED: leucine-rich repeat-containing protein 57 isoform X2 [Cyphomyrmex costatus]
MGNSALKRHYETAEKTATLKLSQCKLDKFSRKLYDLAPTLRTLDLSENNFTTLPNEIGDFTLLKQLNFSHNRLTVLPGTLGALEKLEGLNCATNQIRSIPSSLANLRHLKQAPGRPGSVQESAHDRAGRRRRPPRDRAQSQSESNRHHLRKAGGLSAIENAATGGELFTAELGAHQTPQGLQGLGVGTRRESL